jgi:hypothetical protein
MDEITEKFVAETLLREHNRLIAAVLGDIESFVGGQDPRISRIVKDVANSSKRIMYTQITKTEVEPKYAGQGKDSQT